MKKIIILLITTALFSCKKEETAPLQKTSTVSEGVFFRVEKTSASQDMDSVGIWIVPFKNGAVDGSYKYYGRITKFNALDCQGDGLRVSLDTGLYSLRAQYYGTTFKGHTSGFRVVSKECMTVVSKP
jgi:hypothetical protein